MAVHSQYGSRFVEWLLRWRARSLILFVVALLLVGTLGYMWIEDLSALDAVYQTAITLSTVGYRDLVTSDAGRVFTILFLIVGGGAFVIMLSSVAALLVEGRIREAVGRRRMENDIHDLRNHIIVCGFGRFGERASGELLNRKAPFAVVEMDVERIHVAEEKGILVLHADATEEDSLLRAGIHAARGIISVLNSDAANVYVALTAKEIRPDVCIVTVAREPHAESKLRTAGADHVLLPYAMGGLNLTRRILQPHLSDFLDLAHGVRVQLEEVSIRAGSPLAHVKLKDTELRHKYSVTVVAVVKTREENVHYNPEPDLLLEAGDVLVVVGPPDGLRGVTTECAGGVVG